MSGKHDSDNEDDLEPFESSGDEWNVENAKKEQTTRRKSTRIITRKSKRRPVVEESGTDGVSEEEEYFLVEAKKRRGPAKRTYKAANKSSLKKPKVTNDSELSNDTNSIISQEDTKNVTTDSDSSRTGVSSAQSRGVHRKFIPKTIYSEDYATGSFVILKKDAQGGDPSKHPVIWRIDGKALLQKYEAFDEDDRVRHKNTSIYTGWSPLDKDLYAPITVDVIRHNNNNLTVEVQWEILGMINADSD